MQACNPAFREDLVDHLKGFSVAACGAMPADVMSAQALLQTCSVWT
jgi:hypothetical protein